MILDREEFQAQIEARWAAEALASEALQSLAISRPQPSKPIPPPVPVYPWPQSQAPKATPPVPVYPWPQIQSQAPVQHSNEQIEQSQLHIPALQSQAPALSSAPSTQAYQPPFSQHPQYQGYQPPRGPPQIQQVQQHLQRIRQQRERDQFPNPLQIPKEFPQPLTQSTTNPRPRSPTPLHVHQNLPQAQQPFNQAPPHGAYQRQLAEFKQFRRDQAPEEDQEDFDNRARRAFEPVSQSYYRFNDEYHNLKVYQPRAPQPARKLALRDRLAGLADVERYEESERQSEEDEGGVCC